MEVKRRTAEMVVEKLRSEATRGEALREVRLMSKHDGESRALISEAGAIPFLTESLHSSSAESQDNAAATILNLSISSGDALIGSNRDIAHALIEMVRSPDSALRSVKDGLKALFGISLHRPNHAGLIELGAVEALFSLVIKDGRVGVVEDATAVIAQVAGCEESGEAFRRVSGIGVLVELLDLNKGSTSRIMENALSGLLNLARCGGAAAEVREMGMEAVDGIADVAEKGSARGKSKAVALLKLLHDGRSNVFTDSRFDSMLNPTPSSN